MRHRYFDDLKVQDVVYELDILYSDAGFERPDNADKILMFVLDDLQDNMKYECFRDDIRKSFREFVQKQC